MDEHDRGNYDPMISQPPPQPAAQASADDYAAAAREAGNYGGEMAPAQHAPIVEDHEGHRNLIISVCALLVLAVAAAGFYWFSLRNKPAPVQPAQTPKTSTTTTAPAAKSQIDTQTKDYSSPGLNLAFSYPADWTVSDPGGGLLTAKSPALSLSAADSKTVSGTIVLTVRDHSQKLTEFSAGNAAATRDSQKVAYTKPTQTQRANTYLSFLQYAQTTTTGALDGIYITGDNGYQKGQAIPMADVGKADPIISITFTDSTGKAMSISDKTWDDTSFSGPLTKLLQSFSIN